MIYLFLSLFIVTCYFKCNSESKAGKKKDKKRQMNEQTIE